MTSIERRLGKLETVGRAGELKIEIVYVNEPPKHQQGPPSRVTMIYLTEDDRRL